MNGQMRADVHAIELNYFQAPDGSQLLAPKLIGETDRTKAEKHPGRSTSLTPITYRSGFRNTFHEVDVASTQGLIYSFLKAPNGNTYHFFSPKLEPSRFALRG
jgi:hypothetical protein